jgi:hypothetical protein
LGIVQVNPPKPPLAKYAERGNMRPALASPSVNYAPREKHRQLLARRFVKYVSPDNIPLPMVFLHAQNARREKRRPLLVRRLLPSAKSALRGDIPSLERPPAQSVRQEKHRPLLARLLPIARCANGTPGRTLQTVVKHLVAIARLDKFQIKIVQNALHVKARYHVLVVVDVTRK